MALRPIPSPEPKQTEPSTRHRWAFPPIPQQDDVGTDEGSRLGPEQGIGMVPKRPLLADDLSGEFGHVGGGGCGWQLRGLLGPIEVNSSSVTQVREGFGQGDHRLRFVLSGGRTGTGVQSGNSSRMCAIWSPISARQCDHAASLSPKGSMSPQCPARESPRDCFARWMRTQRLALEIFSSWVISSVLSPSISRRRKA